MVVHRRLLDALIRHRLDLVRYTKHEASVILGILEKHDRRLVTVLRGRLPHIRPGDISGARVKSILKGVRVMRLEALKEAHSDLRKDLLELGKVEAATVGRIAESAMPVRVRFNPIRAATMRQAVVSQPFAGGQNAARTLSQWFGAMAQSDQRRLLGAIQLGVRNQETVDTMVKRVAGTRANRYTDGVLSVTRREAETAVRTAVNHVANAAVQEWGAANSDVVAGFEWIAMLDERLCPLCAAEAGKFIPNGNVEPPTGMTMASGSPPIHPNDRCTMTPILAPERLAARIPDKIGDEEMTA